MSLADVIGGYFHITTVYKYIFIEKYQARKIIRNIIPITLTRYQNYIATT